MRRAERLVAAGVIDKVSLGRTDSFRSVAYTYFAEEDDDDDEDPPIESGAAGGGAGAGARGGINATNSTIPSSVATDQPQASSSTEVLCVRAVGEDLYHHLRVVLGRCRCPSRHP